jgi:hypothetical protein
MGDLVKIPEDRAPVSKLRGRQAPKPSRWSKRRRDDVVRPPQASLRPSPPPAFDASDLGFFEGGLAREQEEPREITAREAHEVPVVDRRSRLIRYVAGAWVLCAAICVAAFVRGRAADAAAAQELQPWSTARSAIAMTAKVEPPVITAVVPVAPPDPPPAAGPPLAVTAAAPDGKTFLQLREAARSALERGQPTDAIALASLAIDKDDTDAQAWLILGAAQLTANEGAAARESFLLCTKRARRGTAGECFAMLRGQ